MTKAEILERAKGIKETFNMEDGDFYIGCTIEELLPNKRTTKLLCVDCSWLNMMQSSIIPRRSLDEIVVNDRKAFNDIQIKMDGNELTFIKWVDMVDDDGDTHHCKIVSYAESSDDIFNPIDVSSIDWVIYVEL